MIALYVDSSLSARESPRETESDYTQRRSTEEREGAGGCALYARSSRESARGAATLLSTIVLAALERTGDSSIVPLWRLSLEREREKRVLRRCKTRFTFTF
jgi:hypothetical protein